MCVCVCVEGQPLTAYDIINHGGAESVFVCVCVVGQPLTAYDIINHGGAESVSVCVCVWCVVWRGWEGMTLLDIKTWMLIMELNPKWII